MPLLQDRAGKSGTFDFTASTGKVDVIDTACRAQDARVTSRWQARSYADAQE
jgi:hypothetical protein